MRTQIITAANWTSTIVTVSIKKLLKWALIFVATGVVLFTTIALFVAHIVGK